jgi:hypothetical protein
MRGNAGDVYGSGGDVDKEQDLVGDETLDRADLDAQEVRRRQTLPVSHQKRRLSGVRVSSRPVDGGSPNRRTSGGLTEKAEAVATLQPGISAFQAPCPISATSQRQIPPSEYFDNTTTIKARTKRRQTIKTSPLALKCCDGTSIGYAKATRFDFYHC